jgi:hypothetical protein
MGRPISKRATVRALLMVSALLAAASFTAAPGQAAASHARKPVRFGAKLNSSIQPSNSFGPHSCKETTGARGACTRVAMIAYGRPDGGMQAPKNGTVKKIRIVAGAAGTFTPEIARVHVNTNFLFKSKAKIVQKGHSVKYMGQGGQDSDDSIYKVETFAVNLPVKKGDYLAIQSYSTSMERCSSGGAQQLLYQPALKKTDPFKKTPFHDGCFLLVEAVYG